MSESLQAQIDTYLPHLNSLIRRGRELRSVLAADSSSSTALAATRVWQKDCVAAINQLSGGSKAHWLSRAYSQAFLMRSTADRAVEEATIGEIVDRLVDVLVQGVASLTQMGRGGPASVSSGAPSPRRFEFVHNPELRPIVEQAYSDSRRALEQGRYGPALLTTCGILEAIVTDALEHKGLGALAADNMPAGTIAGWPFEARLTAAEKAGLIRGGCARLPAVARKYRDLTNADGEPAPDVAVSERDARLAGQVLHVVMRDLDPGR
jgi:hypothetical protein